MINTKKKISKSTFPYPYIIIEDFFENEFYKKIESEFPIKKDFLKFPDSKVGRMNYDTSFGDELYSNLINKSLTFKLLHDFIYGEKFMKMFLDLFSKDIEDEIKNSFLKIDIKNTPLRVQSYEVNGIISKHDFKKKKDNFLYPRLDIGIGEIGYGNKLGGGGIHIDNPQRMISILFFAGGYKKMNGGEHRIWKKINNEIKVEKVIQPKPNLLLASIQNNMGFHDVNPIKEISGTRNALYIAISCNNPIWKKVKVNNFNFQFNKNRCKLNLFFKLKRFFQNLFNSV